MVLTGQQLETGVRLMGDPGGGGRLSVRIKVEESRKPEAPWPGPHHHHPVVSHHQPFQGGDLQEGTGGQCTEPCTLYSVHF